MPSLTPWSGRMARPTLAGRRDGSPTTWIPSDGGRHAAPHDHRWRVSRSLVRWPSVEARSAPVCTGWSWQLRPRRDDQAIGRRPRRAPRRGWRGRRGRRWSVCRTAGRRGCGLPADSGQAVQPLPLGDHRADGRRWGGLAGGRIGDELDRPEHAEAAHLADRRVAFGHVAQVGPDDVVAEVRGRGRALLVVEDADAATTVAAARGWPETVEPADEHSVVVGLRQSRWR